VSDALPFRGTAPFYRFRVPYPADVFAFLRAEFALDPGRRVLDLGCGPGTLSIPLSRLVAEVVALDIDAEMLAEGERQASHAGRQNIRWLRSRAEDVSSELGRFRLVTLGQSFHWMDRDSVLRRLAPLVEDGGGLALVAPGRRRPQESWEALAQSVVARYLGPRDRHPRANPEPADEPALRRSEDFEEVGAREFPSVVERDVPSILGWVYSSSTSARHRFGERVQAFERDLAEALGRASPSGIFRETVETEVAVVRKRAATP
jgi:ubiquinone/menaquinone biosynthesis C-methylase UbiE